MTDPAAIVDERVDGETTVEPMGLAIPGRTFLAVHLLDVHDGGRTYRVVRDDGTVVERTDAGLLAPGPPRDELAAVLAAVDPLDATDVDPVRLARAALALHAPSNAALSYGSGAAAERFAADDRVDDVVDPTWERQGEGGRLSFCVLPTGRAAWVDRIDVDVSPAYDLAVREARLAE